MIHFAARSYVTLIRLGMILAPLALLILRLAWGWQLFETGRAHLTNLQQTTDFFQSLGIPYPRQNAMLSGTTEMVGGLLWMAGLATRLISVPMLINFCVAYWTASHDKVLSLFHGQNPSTFINDDAFPFLITSLLLLTVGPGIISIDALLQRTVFRKQAAMLLPRPAN